MDKTQQKRLIMLLDSAERSLNYRLDMDLVFSEDLYYEIKSIDDTEFNFPFSLLRSRLLQLREIEEKYCDLMDIVKRKIEQIRDEIK